MYILYIYIYIYIYYQHTDNHVVPMTCKPTTTTEKHISTMGPTCMYQPHQGQIAASKDAVRVKCAKYTMILDGTLVCTNQIKGKLQHQRLRCE